MDLFTAVNAASEIDDGNGDFGRETSEPSYLDSVIYAEKNDAKKAAAKEAHMPRKGSKSKLVKRSSALWKATNGGMYVSYVAQSGDDIYISDVQVREKVCSVHLEDFEC